ncbi:hypothetical protein [Clostridium tyrobutyricum]|nr:hypothetical protein [Clostridium tyrobutyricum]
MLEFINPPNNNKNDDVPGTVMGQSPGTPSTVDKDIDIDIDIDNKRE